MPSLTRVFDFSPSSPSSEVNNALRALCEGKPADVRWREGRPWVLAEEVGFDDSMEGGKGTLKVTGVVRGTPLSVDLLVHLTGREDYRISRVGCMLCCLSHVLMAILDPFSTNTTTQAHFGRDGRRNWGPRATQRRGS